VVEVPKARLAWSQRWLAMFLLAGCVRGSVSVPVAPTSETLASQDAGPRSAVACDAACWQGRAEHARALGIDDVAAALLGRAYAVDPSAPRLEAYLDALVAAGRLRRARAVLDTPEAAALLDLTAYRERVGPARPDRPVAPTRAQPWIRAAMDADDPHALVQALEHSDEPKFWADLGGAWRRRGEAVLARRSWSRARALVDERGATMRLEPVAPWPTRAVTWLDDRLVLVRDPRPSGRGAMAIGTVLEAWRRHDGLSAPGRRVYLPPTTEHVFASSVDGSTVVQVDAGGVSLHDAITGVRLRSMKVDGEHVDALAIAGEGDRHYVLVASGSGTTLLGPDGEVLETFTLEGTTPTITRVYRAGDGTRHGNILQDSRSWATALAVSDDARWVAIGGSDSKTRLFDRRTGRERMLAYAWTYHERRQHGANPDQNAPLALRFVDDDRSLVALYSRGDVITWRTSDGKKLAHAPGRCSAQEVRELWLYDAPGTSIEGPISEARAACGMARHGALSLDGRLAVTSGALDWGIRIRSVDGTPMAAIVDEQLPEEQLAFGSGRRLALANVYGATRVWTPEEGMVRVAEGPVETGPIRPQLSDDGRHLRFMVQREPVVWDLFERSPADPAVDLWQARERDVRGSPDGRVRLSRTDDGRLRIETDVVRTIGQNVKEAQVAPDGSFVTWIERRPRDPVGSVKLLSLSSSESERARTVDGWVVGLDVRPDGAEVLVYTERKLLLWGLDDEPLREAEIGITGARRVAYSDDARRIHVEYYGQVDVHAHEPGLPRLVSVFPTHSGGWLAVNAAGAVDGSDDAVDFTMTIVEGLGEPFAHDGALAWDRLHVEDHYREAVVGLVVEPWIFQGG
jgi:hypothetical protein